MPIRSLLILSVGGVRGAITLAGVMTLPLALDSGEPFPGRELAIMLAATTIIVSLLGASISLPLLLRGMPQTPDSHFRSQHALARNHAREAASAALAREIQHLAGDVPGAAQSAYGGTVERILANLDDALGDAPSDDELDAETTRNRRNDRHLQQLAVQAARSAIFHLARQGKVSDELAREMVRRLDLDELRIF